jgi:hypothetical protein
MPEISRFFGIILALVVDMSLKVNTSYVKLVKMEATGLYTLPA